MINTSDPHKYILAKDITSILEMIHQVSGDNEYNIRVYGKLVNIVSKKYLNEIIENIKQQSQQDEQQEQQLFSQKLIQEISSCQTSLYGNDNSIGLLEDRGSFVLLDLTTCKNKVQKFGNYCFFGISRLSEYKNLPRLHVTAFQSCEDLNINFWEEAIKQLQEWVPDYYTMHL